MTYSATEMMTVAAARALGNDDICFVGIGLPSAACNLARLTHAPRLTLVYESGTLETKPRLGTRLAPDAAAAVPVCHLSPLHERVVALQAAGEGDHLAYEPRGFHHAAAT